MFWCRGFAAVCDCGTPWTFLLTFYCTLRFYVDIATNNILASSSISTSAQEIYKNQLMFNEDECSKPIPHSYPSIFDDWLTIIL